LTANKEAAARVAYLQIIFFENSGYRVAAKPKSVVQCNVHFFIKRFVERDI
jgi:hypothetical protein